MLTGKIDITNGLPALVVNGQREVPMMFFGNTDIVDRYDVTAKGIAMAAAHGVHLHSITTVLPVYQKKGQRDFSHAINSMRLALKADPEAKILLRVNMNVGGAHATMGDEKAIGWAAEYPDDLMRFVVYNPDGTTSVSDGHETTNGYETSSVSIASDLWLEACADTLAEFTEALKAEGLYDDALLGYHIGGAESGEWFHIGLREKGIDLSPTNRRAFISYLREKYSAIEVLNAAWDMALADFEAVELPADIPGNDRTRPAEITLFTGPDDQRFVDYGEYASRIVTNRITKLAAAARKTTRGEKLIAFFYGYYFDLYDARTGHFDLHRVLDCPDIDILTSPICYTDRNEGGVGALMSPADSVALHGKLWMIENDIRTLLTYRLDDSGENWPKVQSIEGVIDVYRREAGTMLAHGCGCWYMDLVARGWQYHPEIWQSIAEIKGLYGAMAPGLDLLRPEVAVCVDEAAMPYSAHAEAMGMQVLYNFRLQFYRAGVKFGLYTFRDVVDGKVPSARVIFHLNPWNLTQPDAKALKAVLARQKATLVLVQSVGVSDDAALAALTELRFERVSGEMLPLEMTPLDGLPMLQPVIADALVHEAQRANPACAAEGGEVLARYTEGRLAGKAALAVAGDVCFFGGQCMTPDLIRALCRRFGAHVYQADNLACICGNQTVAVHAGNIAGNYTVTLPEGEHYTEVFSGKTYSGAASIPFRRNGTALLRRDAQ